MALNRLTGADLPKIYQNSGKFGVSVPTRGEQWEYQAIRRRFYKQTVLPTDKQIEN